MKANATNFQCMHKAQINTDGPLWHSTRYPMPENQNINLWQTPTEISLAFLGFSVQQTE
jgi:hypothetical protein